MDKKPSIQELEALLADDTKQVTICADGTVKVEDASSHDAIVRKLNLRIEGLEMENVRLRNDAERIKAWIKLCPYINND